MAHNYGVPVLVHTQTDEIAETFFGIVLRIEGGYDLGYKRYRGKVSVVHRHGGWGQHERIQIIHGISHINDDAVFFWAYLDEVDLVKERAHRVNIKEIDDMMKKVCDGHKREEE